jgi:hypothetical protein
MEPLIKFITEQWSEIQKAPAIFMVALVLVAWGAYLFARFQVKERIALRDEQLASYKEKLSGASPDEAKARIDGLEATLKRLMDHTKARWLTEDQVDAISRVLIGSKHTIEIAQDSAAIDGENYSEFLHRAFEQGGWDASNPTVAGDFNVPTGLAVVLKDLKSYTPAERRVVDALNAAGVKFDVRSFDFEEISRADTDAIVLVGVKPI